MQRVEDERAELLAHLIDEGVLMEHNPDDPFCDCPECTKGLEEAGLLAPKDKWTLQDIEESVQARIDAMSKGHPEIGDAPFSEWLRCYEVLAQIKQAQALDQIVKLLKNGIPIERVN